MKLSGPSPRFFGRTENLSYPDLTLYIIPRNLWCCQDLRWHTSDLFRTDTTLISTWGNVKSFSFNSGKWRICRRRSMRASAHPRRKKEKKTIREKERIGRFLSNWIRSTTVERSGTKNRAGTFGTCYQTKVKVLSGKPLLMDRFDGLTRAVNWTEGPSSAAK